VWIPGRPRDGGAGEDSTPVHRREQREGDDPPLHVLHSESKELHLQKPGAGHRQEQQVSHTRGFIRVRTVMENLEKSWKTWKSHGI